jgi:hypothetical protein
MQDKHWRDGWKAVYSLVPYSIVVDLCDVVLGSPEEKEEAGTSILLDKAGEKIEESATDAGAALMKRGASKALSKGSAVALKGLGKVLQKLMAAYSLYKANTEGPSPHAAALETTALIMGKVYGESSGQDGVIRRGGFIPTGTTSYCRVARQQLGPFPELKDRKTAFDLMGNRVYERMRDLIAPKHLESPEAFYAFRNARVSYAENIVEAAGGDLMGRKVKLLRASEEEIERMEENMESTSRWQAAHVSNTDMTKPLQLPVPKMSSDQNSGIGNAIRERYGLLQQ